MNVNFTENLNELMFKCLKSLKVGEKLSCFLMGMFKILTVCVVFSIY
jgi:hypothetical protein